MTPAARAAPFAIALLFVTAGSACALDWNVRPDPGVGPSPGEAGMPPDASPDTATTDRDAPATDAPPGEGGADCMALAAAVAKAKKRARACQLVDTTACHTSVRDECNCEQVVTKPGAPETTAYTDAVAALVAAGCATAACGTACAQLVVMTSWKCLQNGPTVECYPFQ